MLGQHDLTFMNEHKAAWPQLLKGFRALVARYGQTLKRANEACLMAVGSGDMTVAEELFNRIGEQPVLSVWRSRKYFEMFRGAALSATARK